ncbi:unnamed protein product [Prunus armeniaca]|uniref:Uncharacterized protein n=1 Tax=Prunus armeniaca TaxID=36596 RepID=A0A6J5XDZ3_PRUAR|nr:unnamed protein product [Prunus armeniaca]
MMDSLLTGENWNACHIISFQVATMIRVWPMEVSTLTRKKSTDSKTILDPSLLKVSEGDAAALQAEVKAVNKQNAGVLLSKDPKCCSSNDLPENPPPTSEWCPGSRIAPFPYKYDCLVEYSPNSVLTFQYLFLGNNDSRELNEGELISDDHDAAVKSSEIISDEGLPLYLPLVIRA